jgi:hypothetical protein
MLLLTSGGLARRVHHLIETSTPIRTAAITATATAVGLAAGRSKTVRKVPAAAMVAGGAFLSFLGMSGIGDGVVASGATILGYRYGATGRFTKRKRAPVAVTAGEVAAARRNPRRG